MRLFIYLALATTCAAGDNGDEFSNNLFTDLAPLLQLFGERFAQQFMSQSMSWVDSLIFAMAPLGIITAIVGSIRVGGPSWLRAAIGRAQENKGAAEIELMSSTSNEVSELWNGQAIVRTMGKPEILQVVYRGDAADGPEFGLYSLDELQRGSGDIELQPSPISHSPKTLRELRNYAPNISLNNNAPHAWSTFEICISAVFGVFVQTAVLIVAAMAQRQHLAKGGVPVKGYALPLTTIGTLFLSIGMFCCASVVEKGSKEKAWGIAGSSLKTSKTELRILWLQRRHFVSDQSFDAFAIIARGPRDKILTSHPAHTAPDNLTVQDPGLTTPYLHSKRFEYAAVLGTLIGLFGFILQFIGLRASHWSVSVAQLTATFVMTAVRAIIRRGLIRRPHPVPLLPDHEIDWLATRIAGNPGTFWKHFSDGEKQGEFLQDIPWAIRACTNKLSRGTWDADPGSRNDKVVAIRQRLGKLSKWSRPAGDSAVSVAAAIEVVMNTLFPFSEMESFTCFLPCLVGEAFITIKKTDGLWKADATQVEAILSLWLFHVREAESAQRNNTSSDIQRKNEDWLREGNSSLKKPSIRILSSNTEKARQNLDWWISGTESQVLSVKQVHDNAQT
ncbi:hypothetical protein BDD12DRAFT_950798, partial [Trichophaea hybrida]